MPITLPPLPFEVDALEPYMSRKTIEFHYGKHHKGYVDKLNELIKGTAVESDSLEEIAVFAKDRMPKIFNNAAQVLNHNFFWKCLAKDPEQPTKAFRRRIAKDFDSFENFKSEFDKQCRELFGSGWVWLVKDKNGLLKIRALQNAGTPLIENEVPILTCDIWEHAYYLDYQNERMRFVENFWKVVNWPAVELNLSRETKQLNGRRFAPESASVHL